MLFRSLTGTITYWRALWVVPAPLLLAVFLTGAWGRGRIARVATLAGLLFTVGFLPVKRFDQPRGRVSFEPFGLKVNSGDLRVAVAARRLTTPGARVLLPAGPSAWVGTLRGHPYPLVTRQSYLEKLAPYLPQGEANVRRRLFDYVSGTSATSEAALLRRSLGEFDLAALAFRRDGRFADEIRDLLRGASWRSEVNLGVFELWSPGPPRR